MARPPSPLLLFWLQGDTTRLPHHRFVTRKGAVSHDKSQSQSREISFESRLADVVDAWFVTQCYPSHNTPVSLSKGYIFLQGQDLSEELCLRRLSHFEVFVQKWMKLYMGHIDQ
ncbi:hypothetical protein BaRGS_00026009 [Batillaria attramentaria]|uniref:Uncharacterized protein n=1 Tax=Batillaria attramentaria TaxID=370345 RepID=A0ABD0K6X7_9CAEN